MSEKSGCLMEKRGRRQEIRPAGRNRRLIPDGSDACEISPEPCSGLLKELLLMNRTTHGMVPLFQYHQFFGISHCFIYLTGMGNRNDRIRIPVNNQDMPNSGKVFCHIEMEGGTPPYSGRNARNIHR